ncbi:MAG: hypothetical protein NWE99_06830 [Candidatus Bathyarchaeota archaeon]|nr:hypothetical protein [Candidatus Bathyarchaeota archaeon]
MARPSWQMQSIWLLQRNLIIWAVNGLLFAILVMFGFNLADLALSGYFSKITLLETGIAFLVGGVLAFSGSILPSKVKEYLRKSEEQWSIEKLRKSEKRANKYILLAAILFVESIAVSFLGV